MQQKSSKIGWDIPAGTQGDSGWQFSSKTSFQWVVGLDD